MTQALIHDGLLHSGRSISRRKFLRGVGVVVVGSALLAVGDDAMRALEGMSGPSAFATRPAELATWVLPTRSSFAKHLGSPFYIQGEAADPVALQLFRVRDLRSKAAMGAQAASTAYQERCFSLVFRGPVNPALPQAVYSLAHEQIGAFSLLLSPLISDKDARYYEAVFNSPQR